MLSPYRKLIAAIVGVLLMMLARWTGIDLSAQEAIIVDVVLGLITIAGVYFAPNKKPA